jgi:hypothetical protein
MDFCDNEESVQTKLKGEAVGVEKPEASKETKEEQDKKMM